MKKEVYIIRHAKSSWENAFDVGDINRPLEVRGVRDAIKMGKRLKEANVHFDGIFSSNGIRALHTACIMAREIGMDSAQINILEYLYHPSPNDLLQAIQNSPEKYKVIAVFAHNPGIEEFVYLNNPEIYQVATNGVIHFEMEDIPWKAATLEALKFISYDKPKHK